MSAYSDAQIADLLRERDCWRALATELANQMLRATGGLDATLAEIAAIRERIEESDAKTQPALAQEKEVRTP